MEFPLRHVNGHIILTTDVGDWIVDTGSPLSFGSVNIVLGADEIQIPTKMMGIGADFLSEHIGLPCKGLLGTDILNAYDVLFDLPLGVIHLYRDNEALDGAVIPIELFLGIPMLTARINGEPMSGFLDTGAQVSYALPRILKPEDMIGTFQDFYPTQGRFETSLYWADLELGDNLFRFRCGAMPDFMEGMMNMCGAECIIGNEVMRERQLGYFPRREIVVLG